MAASYKEDANPFAQDEEDVNPFAVGPFLLSFCSTIAVVSFRCTSNRFSDNILSLVCPSLLLCLFPFLYVLGASSVISRRMYMYMYARVCGLSLTKHGLSFCFVCVFRSNLLSF